MAKKKLTSDEPVFNPYSDIDDVLDSIEKSYGLMSAGLDKNEKRLSTGLLVLDLIIGKGVAGGGWYTLFGGESCAKSTTASTIMANSVNSDIPIIQLWDYEGCFTKETLIRVNGKDVKFEEIVKVDKLVEGFNNVRINVDTLGQTVEAKIFYGGEKQCTEIEFDGGSFEGANHPIMILNTDGNLEWKKVEDVRIGDFVLAQA